MARVNFGGLLALVAAVVVVVVNVVVVITSVVEDSNGPGVVYEVDVDTDEDSLLVLAGGDFALPPLTL